MRKIAEVKCKVAEVVYFLKCIFLKCFYLKCIFAKCTPLACLLSFASLLYLATELNSVFIIGITADTCANSSKQVAGVPMQVPESKLTTRELPILNSELAKLDQDHFPFQFGCAMCSWPCS